MAKVTKLTTVKIFDGKILRLNSCPEVKYVQNGVASSTLPSRMKNGSITVPIFLHRLNEHSVFFLLLTDGYELIFVLGTDFNSEIYHAKYYTQYGLN